MTPAALAIEATVALLEDAGLPVSRDAGSFYPQPLGILVGLPRRTGATLGAVFFELPVTCVSADPVNRTETVDALYGLADQAADALGLIEYRPTDWRGGVDLNPLPGVELLAAASVPWPVPATLETMEVETR